MNSSGYAVYIELLYIDHQYYMLLFQSVKHLFGLKQERSSPLVELLLYSANPRELALFYI